MRKEVVQINNMWGGKIPELALKRAVSLTLQEELGKEDKRISLAFVSRAMMRRLNLQYRKKDSVTDVLAFPLTNQVGPAKNLLGEIVICPQVASLQAKQREHTLEDELLLLVIHGTLHLLGYTDGRKEDRELMRKKERKILRLLGKKESIV